MNKNIWIRTKTSNFYKLIRKLNDLNIEIYDSKKTNNYLYLKVSVSGYKRIKKYIVSYKFKIVKKEGINNIFDLLKKNKLYTMVIVISGILMIILTHLIIEVEVVHQNDSLRSLIYEELKYYGIKNLNFNKNYDEINTIKNEILDKYKDRIEWLEIEKVGMKYIIKLQERIINVETEEEPYCDVYAKESGVITSISVKKGVPVVKIGDYISEGDLLISGQIIYNDILKSEVCAEGIIKAERWYETSLSIPFEYFEYVETDYKRYNFSWEHEDKKTQILNSRIENYESDYITLFDLFGYKLHLEIQKEIIKKYKTLTVDEALNKALELSEEKMEDKLDDLEYIKEKKVLKKTENNSTIEVDIFIVTEEIIN